MDWYKKSPRVWLWAGWLVLIVALGWANIWLFNRNFFKDAPGRLPQIKLNMVSASSFVIQNKIYGTETLNESLNILVLGQAGSGHIAPNLTDTIAVIRLDASGKKIKVVSIPRDLAVKTNGGVTKINSLYQTGLKDSEKAGFDLIKRKVEEVTGLTLDSFVLFDLTTVQKVIDDIGGLNVFVKEDILDTRFPTDRGSYEIFKLNKGQRYLDGETALKFVRTRNSLGGDFDRMERQQEVLKAIKGKIISLNPIWDFPKLWGIFKTAQKNIRTNLSLNDLKNIWNFAKDMDLEKIETLSLNPENELVTPQKMNFGSAAAYVLVAKKQPFDYTDIHKAVAVFVNSK
ncbi:MAG: LCP family protein [Parcubacteria group bacterium]|nr:LCP family protein [Parcubacteria group bacterium]